MRRDRDYRGALIAFSIIAAWFSCLVFSLNWEIRWSHPLTYILFFLQTHLYTGLFITAHDSMHGVVSPNRKVNHALGRACALLFALNAYGNLLKKHHEHHRHVGTDSDPDYHSGGFWPWYLSFLKQYISIWQVLLMAGLYNVIGLFYPERNVLFYWAIPSILSTFQLFYFGTYIPHRGEHSPANKHRSRSQRKNHLLAFFSCYFFGYHYEHHASPSTPWWELYKVKEQFEKA